MKLFYLIHVTFLNLCFLLVFSTFSYAGNCTICGVEVEKTDQEQTVSCSAGHEIDRSCLLHQVASTEITSAEQAREIEEQGLKCWGEEGRCPEKLSLKKVKKQLKGTQDFANLTKKLASATSPSDAATLTTDHTASERSHAIKVQEFSRKIQEAFNLSCPNCGGVLAPIEGCNVATCDSRTCQGSTRFCYLCFEPQTDNESAHAHTLTHSSDYWENRDGHTGFYPEGPSYQEIKSDGTPYTYRDRYHWLIVRQKLEFLFQEELDGKVKEDTVELLKPFLQQNKMWPFPVGQQIDSWIKKVVDATRRDKKNGAALLQNEYIFQRQLPRSEEDRTLNPLLFCLEDHFQQRAFKSLDFRDRLYDGPLPHVTQIVDTYRTDARVRSLYAHLSYRAPLFFSLGGSARHIYRISDPAKRVEPFILSGNALTKMSLSEATQFCEKMGARLPTKDEVHALSRAMTYDDFYYPNMISGLLNTYFWTSNKHEYLRENAYLFSGTEGKPIFAESHERYTTRCVVSAP